MIVSDIQKIKKKLPADLQKNMNFVLVPIDSSIDTPKKLKKFANLRKINDWLLLNGGTDPVLELAMMLGVKYKKLKGGGYSHSNIISVVNAAGVVVHQQIGLNQAPTKSAEVLRNLKK